jgi:hypothetical protein
MKNYLKDFTDFKEFRVIHTGLYGNTAYEILCSIEGQLSDGRWENSPRMEGYWKNEHVILNSEEDPEILIIVNSNAYNWEKVQYRWSNTEHRMLYRNKWFANHFHDMNDYKVLNWFADKIKSMVTYEMKDNSGKNWWTKNLDQELEYLGYTEKINVGDCKNVYKMLKLV